MQTPAADTEASHLCGRGNSYKKKATKVDKTGGFNPRWNTKLLLTCDERFLRSPGYVLTLDLFSDGLLRKKLIGTVTIPLLDIARDERIAEKAQVMAFQVRSRRTRQLRGVLNVSIKLGEKRIIHYHYGGFTQQASQAPYPPGYGSGGYGAQYAVPNYAYPQLGQSHYGAGAGYQRRPRRGGPGLGTGLAAGALGGLVVGDMIDDVGDFGGCDF
ncbi:hypothetical protein R1flu_011095 [Riccia fluitans]|uniref:C2 domain-containing protein n=1 Tax=Riccia fluitans TaxID=41844 RepID=A0ABD1Z704_9MARC